MNETEKTDIIKFYPNSVFYEDYACIEVLNDIQISLNYCDISQSYAWDTKGTDFTEKIQKIVEYAKSENNVDTNNTDNKFLYFLNNFKKSFYLTHPIDNVLFPDYDGKNDMLWNFLRLKYNVKTDRKLHVVTWGTAFIFDFPQKCEKVYDSKILRGSVTIKQRSEEEDIQYKIFIKLRGINPKIQYEVRGAELFEKFMENIVAEIEINNLHTIGIFCSRGHHRSVSCAEMLINLYQNRTVEHVTINM